MLPALQPPAQFCWSHCSSFSHQQPGFSGAQPVADLGLRALTSGISSEPHRQSLCHPVSQMVRLREVQRLTHLCGPSTWACVQQVHSRSLRNVFLINKTMTERVTK